MSEETAELLIDGGKAGWVMKRPGRVSLKGKGEMVTYWLTNKAISRAGSEQSFSSFDGDLLMTDQGKESRLIEWIVETLCKFLEKIVAQRKCKIGCPAVEGPVDSQQSRGKKASFLDEVQEIIALPEFDSDAARAMAVGDKSNSGLDAQVVRQLRSYVAKIASLYRRNDFHNFEHASHVMMSVTKLMSRIIAPSDLELENAEEAAAATLHDHTFGITSDALTQFACAFSAMIHDVDHVGVPNAQLIKERAPVAIKYRGRSVAEQNSLAISWDLLMSEEFEAFRKALIATEDESTRFRQLVVNMVMATDIVDKDLKALRNGRWDRAFSSTAPEEEGGNPRDAINRKATIVIEHLIQASDVSHTMQHWHVYRKWNERFFRECYQGFLDGRSPFDPSKGWYKGELGFFDFYIIPLANKLKECGVFGKGSSEYLDYATRNRSEWEAKGQEAVAEMIRNMHHVNKRRASMGSTLS